MLMRAAMIIAFLIPHMAAAADLSRGRRHHAMANPTRYATDQNVVIRCTSTDLGLFTYSNCGQGFDPLAAAAGR